MNLTKIFKRKKSKSGFTLIELIIVIAILAVLMMIAIPAMSGYTEDAKMSVAKTNIKTIESNLVYGLNTIDTNLHADRLFIGDIFHTVANADEKKILDHLNEVLPTTIHNRFAIVVETKGAEKGKYFIYYTYDQEFAWNVEGYIYYTGKEVEKGVLFPRETPTTP